jgi:hypothetical protein
MGEQGAEVSVHIAVLSTKLGYASHICILLERLRLIPCAVLLLSCSFSRFLAAGWAIPSARKALELPLSHPWTAVG